MVRTIFIHNENSARISALCKHIIKFNPLYEIKLVTIDTINQYDISIDDYLFILNENAIRDYGHVYLQYFNKDRLVFPDSKNIDLECSKSFCRQYISDIGLSHINPNFNILSCGISLNILSTLDYTNKVIKADGLAGGKGVYVYNDHFTTNDEASNIMLSLLGKHSKIVLEEKLIGQEFSLISLSWHNKILHFPLIQDFKRRNNNNTGPNTGGMGTITFADGLMPFINIDEYQYCCNINEKVIKNSNYTGFLYGSFIKTVNNEIKLIEYNVRLGDSEAVNILGLLNSSLIDYLDNPNTNSLIIRTGLYSYFRYLVPITYPTHPLDTTTNSIHFTINTRLENIEDVFYMANCSKTDLQNVYRICNGSRTCGIFTIADNITDVVKNNDMYIKMVYGEFHYRTDIGNYFISRLQNYITHLDNYNHIISNTKNNIDRVNELICVSRDKLSVIGKIGDFANSIQYENTRLICSVDGAGTKTKFLVNHPDRFKILGNDIVIHNINDMYCNNGIPIALLDYYGCDTLNKQQFNEFISGVLEICQIYNIPLIGGETAEMRGIFNNNEIEVLGILLGIIENSPMNGNDIYSGNYIYGINSNGAHTNGYTKLREIDQNHIMPDYIKQYFSQPHKCYVNIMEHIILILSTCNIKVLGKAHITGGGFIDNLERILPPNNNLKLDLIDQWELSNEWQWVFDHANLEWCEFIRVFNAGWGFCFVTNSEIPEYIINHICEFSSNTDNIKLLGRIA